jgi:hypothetical protein
VKNSEIVAAGVRRVQGFQHLEVVEGCCKGCVQDSSLRIEAERKLRKDKVFDIVEG